jgi:hypothetical protein
VLSENKLEEGLNTLPPTGEVHMFLKNIHALKTTDIDKIYKDKD